MTIEDRIISLLDGELNSAEQQKLFADISASPKHQQLLEHHRMLHTMARSSMASVRTPTGLEQQIFSKIAAIPTQTPTPLVQSQSYRKTAIAALLLLITSVGASLMFRSNQADTTTTVASNNIANQSVNTAEFFAPSQVQNTTSRISKASAGSTVVSDHSSLTNDNSSFVNTIGDKSSNTVQNISIDQMNIASSAIPTSTELATIPSTEIHFVPNNLTHGRSRSIDDLRNPHADSYPSFEVSLQTSSGFTSPADQQAIKPFAEQRLSLGYHLGYSDVVGVRVSSGLYELPGAIKQSNELGITVMEQSMETRRSFGGELFLSHQFIGVLGTPLTAVVTAAAGIIPRGSTLAAEAGVRIPIANDIAFSVDFSLTRVHSTIDRASTVVNNADASASPVMFVGSDIRTTVNGSLHYGIQYRF